ncbi:hypothetical protein RRG08_003344, partial [Elysia crispata]
GSPSLLDDFGFQVLPVRLVSMTVVSVWPMALAELSADSLKARKSLVARGLPISFSTCVVGLVGHCLGVDLRTSGAHADLSMFLMCQRRSLGVTEYIGFIMPTSCCITRALSPRQEYQKYGTSMYFGGALRTGSGPSCVTYRRISSSDTVCSLRRDVSSWC